MQVGTEGVTSSELYCTWTTRRIVRCIPVRAEELEHPGAVEDLLSDLAVLEAAALHAVLVERQHAVRQAHCKGMDGTIVQSVSIT